MIQKFVAMVHILTRLFCFWTLSIVLFLFERQRFGDWILSPSSGRSLVSWDAVLHMLTSNFNDRQLPNCLLLDTLNNNSHTIEELKQDISADVTNFSEETLPAVVRVRNFRRVLFQHYQNKFNSFLGTYIVSVP
jgi:hypothetical protein